MAMIMIIVQGALATDEATTGPEEAALEATGPEEVALGVGQQGGDVDGLLRGVRDGDLEETVALGIGPLDGRLRRHPLGLHLHARPAQQPRAGTLRADHIGLQLRPRRPGLLAQRRERADRGRFICKRSSAIRGAGK